MALSELISNVVLRQILYFIFCFVVVIIRGEDQECRNWYDKPGQSSYGLTIFTVKLESIRL